MIRRLALLLGLSLALWVVIVFPARRLGDELALPYSAVALGLCLIPAAATLLWGEFSNRSPAQQLLLALGGMGVRVAFVLGAAAGLYFLVPYFQETHFWVWVLVFYLITLALEMTLLLVGRAPAGDS